MNQTAELKLKNNVDASLFTRAVKQYKLPNIEEADGSISAILDGIAQVDPSTNPVTFAECARSPNIFKWAACTTVAATDVWTPAAGKRFRILGGSINMAGGLVAAGLETVDIQEETLGSIGLKFGQWVPIAASAASGPQITFTLGPKGYLATLPDKKVQVVLGGAMTAGAVEVTLWGLEE